MLKRQFKTLSKVFKTKLIKEGGKISNQHLKVIQVTKKSRHILPSHNCTYFLQPIHCFHCKQYRLHHDSKQRKKRLDEKISQNNMRIGNYGRPSIKNSEPC